MRDTSLVVQQKGMLPAVNELFPVLKLRTLQFL